MSHVNMSQLFFSSIILFFSGIIVLQFVNGTTIGKIPLLAADF